MNKVKLDDLVSIKTGRLNANAAEEDGKYLFFTTAKEVSRINSYSYEGEVVLVAGNGDLNVKYYDGKFDAYQRTYILSNKNNSKLDMKYLYYFMLRYVERLRNESIGGVIKYIKISNLTEAKVLLPDLRTQKRVISILEQAGSIINERKNQLQELDSLIQSIFLKETKNVNEEDYTTLGKVFDISSGATPSRKNPDYWKDGDIPWVKSTSVNGSRVSEADEYITQLGFENSSTKLFPKDTVLIAMYGQGKTRGQVGILDFETTTNQACAGLEPIEEINMDFIFYQLKSQYKQLRSLGRGGNQKNLSITVLKDFEILLPPIELQNEFAEKVKEIELVKEKMQISLDEMNTLFDALMQKAFTGELV